MSSKKYLWYGILYLGSNEERIKAELNYLSSSEDYKGLIEEIFFANPDIFNNPTSKTGGRSIIRGYLFVKAIMSPELWSAIYKINFIYGFIGSKNPLQKPHVIPESDILDLKKNASKYISSNLDSNNRYTNFHIGDKVKILTNLYKNKTSTIEAINATKKIVKLSLEVYGKKMQIWFKFKDIEKTNE